MTKFDQLPEGAKENLIAAMIKISIGQDGDKIRKLISQIGIDEDQKALLQRAIISQLSSQRKQIEEEEEGITNSLPVREPNFCLNSLSDIIQKLCDLQDIQPETDEKIIKSYIYQNLQDLTTSSEKSDYWNESIAELIQNVIKMIENYSSQNRDEIAVISDDDDNSIMTIGDLRNADAGNSFQIKQDEPSNRTEWVKPFKNIDNQNYNNIRYYDQILDILANSNKLDRTKKQKNEIAAENNDTSFISLLMPRYGRRVEIEDLNRNFWVIAQIVDGMSSWIFEQSPFTDIISKMIDETAQLWENILYLWLELFLISQKKSDEILDLSAPIRMIEHEDLLNYEAIPYAAAKRIKNDFNIEIPKFKFLDQEIDLKEKEIPNPLIDLEETYAEQDLCYVSKIKVNNYRKNYYNGEYFDSVYLSILNGISGISPQVILQKRKLYTYTIKEVYEENGQEKYRPLLISVHPQCEPIDGDKRRFTPYLLGASNNEGKYLIGYPFSETNKYLIENKRENLYCGIRVIPKIEIERNEDGKKIIKDFQINVYDAINNIFDTTRIPRLIGSYKKERIENNNIVMKYYQEPEITIPDIISKIKIKDNFANYTLAEIEWKNIDFAYYLGEIISWKEKTARMSNIESIIEPTAIMLKIGNFLPEGEKNEYPDYPVPTIMMASQKNSLASQFRGDFTFKGIPKYYNKPIESASYEDDPDLSRDPETNAFGENTEPGQLCFYYFDWSTYLPNKDKPGEQIDTRPQSVQSTIDGLCFESSRQLHYKKVLGNTIDEAFIKGQGINAVKNFILKTRKTEGHYYQFLYQKICYFITFIGLAPYSTDIDNVIKQDINAVCHIMKYIPAPKSLERKENSSSQDESYMSNYNNFYLSYAQLGEEILDDNGEPIGKIILNSLINKYDTFYDYGDFTSSLNQSIPDQNLYLNTNNDKERGIIIKNNKDICNSVIINDTIYAYKIDASTDFIGNISYYDFGAVRTSEQLKDLLLGNQNSIYQLSTADVKLYNDEYEQINEGKIRPYNGSSFYNRIGNETLYPQEENSMYTGLLINTEQGKREAPIKDGKIIMEEGLTPEIIFGANRGIFKNCEYKYDGELSTPYDSNYSYDKNDNLPNSVLIVNQSYKYKIDSDEIIGIKIKEDEYLNYIPAIVVEKANSDKNAYRDFIASAREDNKKSGKKLKYYFFDKTPWMTEEKDDEGYNIRLVNNNDIVVYNYYNAELVSIYEDQQTDNSSHSTIGYINTNKSSIKNGTIDGSCCVNVFYEDERNYFKFLPNKRSNGNFVFYLTNQSPSLPTEQINEKYVVITTKKQNGDAINYGAFLFEKNKCSENARNTLGDYGLDVLIYDYTTKIYENIINDVKKTNSEPIEENEQKVITIDGIKYTIFSEQPNIFKTLGGDILLTMKKSFTEKDLPEFLYIYNNKYNLNGNNPKLNGKILIIQRDFSDIESYKKLIDMKQMRSGEKMDYIGSTCYVDSFDYVEGFTEYWPTGWIIESDNFKFKWEKNGKDICIYVWDNRILKNIILAGIQGVDERTDGVQGNIYKLRYFDSQKTDHIQRSNIEIPIVDLSIDGRPLPKYIFWKNKNFVYNDSKEMRDQIAFCELNTLNETDQEFYKKLIIDVEHKYDYLELRCIKNGNYEIIDDTANALEDWEKGMPDETQNIIKGNLLKDNETGKFILDFNS